MREVIHDFAQWLAKKSYTPPKMQYYSHVDGMERWAAPQPMSKCIPQWYRNLPKQNHDINSIAEQKEHVIKTAPLGIHPDFGVSGHTIKTCPGMQDIMTTGYMVPFWSSVVVTSTLDGTGVLVHSSSTNKTLPISDFDGDANSDFTVGRSLNPDSIEVEQYLRGIGFTTEEIGDWKKFQKRPEIHNGFKTHPEWQYATMKNEMPKEWCTTLLKLETPWKVVTPPGYSVLYTDPTYHFNDCIQVMPGILNSDYWHESNAFFFVKQRGVQFSIDVGQPLLCHIPIKREKLPLEVRKATEEDKEKDRETHYYINAHWGSSQAYRKYLNIFKSKKGECPHKKN